MSQPDVSIAYDAEKVQARAYARIGELTMQVDQLVVALELAKMRELEQARAGAVDVPADPNRPPGP